MSLLSLNENIAQIVLKVSSDKGTVRLGSLEESVDNYCENLDPDQEYMTHFTVNAFAINDEDERIMDIGVLKGILFEPEMVFSERMDFNLLCDMLSSDACEMAAAVTDENGEILPSFCHPEQDIMYIRKLYVEEACRGHGVGRYLLDNANALVRHSLNRNFHLCTLMPYPQIKTKHGAIERAEGNVGHELTRLKRFYEKAGFAKIDGSECMYRKYTDGLDELFGLLGGE